MEHSGVIAFLKALDTSSGNVAPATGSNSDYTSQPIHQPLDLTLRFNDIPQTDQGFIFGSSPNCDFVLNTDGVSDLHFTLTFDDENRLVVRDLGSLKGTQVTYIGEGLGFRRGFEWIVGGHTVAQKMSKIIIHVGEATRLRVQVPPQDITCPAYISEVSRFRQGLGISISDLMAPRLFKEGPQPTQIVDEIKSGEILIRTLLGSGAFGMAIREWDVSTGSVWVVKIPIQAYATAQSQGESQGRVYSNRQPWNQEAWDREGRIMMRMRHPHIVRSLGYQGYPKPMLYLEYAPGGSLECHKDITCVETVEILRQALAALVYMHEGNPPVAHRDIKPANILVQRRIRGVMIHVKLGDFGVSRDRVDMQTRCGTELYLAPEAPSPQGGSPYTAAVDIWSLGVTSCELAFGLPEFYEQLFLGSEVLSWGQRVRKYLEDKLIHGGPAERNLRDFLLQHMLVLDPNLRSSARVCHRMIDPSFQTEDHTLHV